MSLTKFAKKLLFATVLALPAFVLAAAPQPYSAKDFANAKAAGKPIVLDFKASWCGVCKIQGKALETLLDEERFDDIVAFTVDYDKETSLKKEFKVISQSTLVVLKGDKELNRAIGITGSKEIAELLSAGS